MSNKFEIKVGTRVRPNMSLGMGNDSVIYEVVDFNSTSSMVTCKEVNGRTEVICSTDFLQEHFEEVQKEECPICSWYRDGRNCDCNCDGTCESEDEMEDDVDELLEKMSDEDLLGELEYRLVRSSYELTPLTKYSSVELINELKMPNRTDILVIPTSANDGIQVLTIFYKPSEDI